MADDTPPAATPDAPEVEAADPIDPAPTKRPGFAARHPVLVYSAARFALLVVVWLTIELFTPVNGLLAMALALVLSGILSLLVLDRQGAAVGLAARGVFRRIDERIERSKAAEDYDDEYDDLPDDPADDPAGEPAHGTDDHPADGPAAETDDHPADDPAGEPVHGTDDHPADGPAAETDDHPADDPAAAGSGSAGGGDREPDPEQHAEDQQQK